MKNSFLALIALCFYSCDYSTSSNGNIDAAFARESIRLEESKDGHGSGHQDADHGGGTVVPAEGGHGAVPSQEGDPDIIENHNEDPHAPANDATMATDTVARDAEHSEKH